MAEPSNSLPVDSLGDIDDYISTNEGEGSLTWNMFSHVFEFVQNGNRAFRDNNFEEAIKCYSRANNIKPGDPVILNNRSAAYIRISRFLKDRPPSASEYRPLNGLDPTVLAELALKDAEKLMDQCSKSVKPYILKANALILLEKYDIAKDIILSGLQIDPLSNPLQASLQRLERIAVSQTGRGRHGLPDRSDEFDCTLCFKLLYEPITTPCGHSFCRSCLFQSMDRGNKCPLCRTVLFISSRTCAISVTLSNIIQKNFPEEYAERKSEHDGLANFGIDIMPLFVMDVVIPCQKFPLHIFEPRYRLMVRRIMEGNHRMGMVIVDSTTGSIADFACEVEITECEPLADGRFYLEIESRRRFHIIRSWDQDGYRVAEIEWVNDVAPAEGTREQAELQEMTNNAAEYAQSWIRKAKEASRRVMGFLTDHSKHDRLLNVEAMMPSSRDPERFSFWLATLSNRRPLERLELLRMTDTRERIRRGLVYLKAEEQGSSLSAVSPPCPPPLLLRRHRRRSPSHSTSKKSQLPSLPAPMGGEFCTTPFPSSLFLLSLLLFFSLSSAIHPSFVPFSPRDNYLIDCGSPGQTHLDDGRIFKSDRESTSLLATEEDVQTSIDSIPVNATVSPLSSWALPLFRTARIFPSDSTYTFFISQAGRHWIRLYFYPLPHPNYNLSDSVFTVTTDSFVLLHDFSIKADSKIVSKEYLINITTDRFSLQFKPKKNSSAFINAIEIVSAPDPLFSDSATSVSPVGFFSGLSHFALEICYRVNVGGPQIVPRNDTLSRTWETDDAYNRFPQGSKNVSVDLNSIKYPGNDLTPLIAPYWVYATAEDLQDSKTMQVSFNMSWSFNVEQSYSYLIRLHFCDIVSSVLNTLYFNVYINGMMGIADLDLSQLTGDLSTPYYRDLVLNASSIKNNTIMIQVGPSNLNSGLQDAILNGVEIMKMSNDAQSLDGLFSVDGKYMGGSRFSAMKIAAIVALGMGVMAVLFLGVMFLRWQKRPQGWEKRKSFSSWLLPLHSNQSSFFSSKSSSRRSSVFGSRRSKTGFSGIYTNVGLGRFFSLNELQVATHNFDEKAVIGVGGFGKVYVGALEDGTKLAIKRGNPSSDQGINEFRTEIEMLSKLRHRHLVSLIGYCDEQSEMILVYEYMANGPFRDHLYGSNLPPLSWKQRLEICIGAARGLHYLHTGAAQGIIHRDVKTTNILLDENFVAKVSDFGLSKAAPSLEQTHVSTAVKGSFGYLDPEYFRRQQLTDKSDVYSFGVVLFEVLCARQVINPTLPREQVNLAEWAMQNYRKGKLEKIIDPVISSSIVQGSLKKFVEAAEKCLGEYGVDRPSMGDVLWNLEYALQLQEAVSELEDPEEDKCEGLAALDKGNDDEPKGKGSASASNDASEVSVSAPLFAEVRNFQGR
ncbi:probable receptor-like protein kinase At5g61350 [Cucurbita maxima]|uniref:Probable receptor-like protein kinase At5g61350 n=1 Tax=Cucurbita maxima TaxID=3661 RepID=A0A6J1KT78_CUCMA|nr:probable receptor-like protein kinase At5g61350 [Cucurbita maxima]